MKTPVLVWKNDKIRVLLVYNDNGYQPLPVIEKLAGNATLGEPRWDKVVIPPEFPLKEVIYALAEATCGKAVLDA